jgi:hypothetical protein
MVTQSVGIERINPVMQGGIDGSQKLAGFWLAGHWPPRQWIDTAVLVAMACYIPLGWGNFGVRLIAASPMMVIVEHFATRAS